MLWLKLRLLLWQRKRLHLKLLLKERQLQKQLLILSFALVIHSVILAREDVLEHAAAIVVKNV
jgi:hypothetical protein